MYCEHFGFSTKPFELLPNPAFLYLSRTHSKALTYLRYGISEGTGFVLLTGEVGSGKTTLVRELIKNHLGGIKLAKVFNTKVDSTQLLSMIVEDFGLDPAGRDKTALIRMLNDFLIEQYAERKRCVLIIDEAQNLSGELLEEVRLLSNLETEQGKLLQIVLVGQPELKEYILCRFERAGNRNALDISDDALDMVHRVTRGTPRLVNILMDYVLLDAFGNGTTVATEQTVGEIIEDLDFERQFWGTGETPPAPPVRKDAASPAGDQGKAAGTNANTLMNIFKKLESRMKGVEKQLARMDVNAVLVLQDRIAGLEEELARQREMTEKALEMAQDSLVRATVSREEAKVEVVAPVRRRSWAARLLLGSE
ncbi:MAG: AAA family ATPase [Halodesulfovibrio sp.]